MGVACKLQPLSSKDGIRVDACGHGTVHVSGANWTIRMTADELRTLADVAAVGRARLEARELRPRPTRLAS